MKIEDLSPKEKKIYQKLLKKYQGYSGQKQEQERIRIEVEEGRHATVRTGGLGGDVLREYVSRNNEKNTSYT